MCRKSVATLIDLRAFHKFNDWYGYEPFIFYARERQYIPCDLIVHSKLIKSQQNIFPLFSICQSKIHDNYNLMYIFHVMYFVFVKSVRVDTIDAIIIYRLNLGVFTNHWRRYTFQNYHMVIYRLEKCPMKGQMSESEAFAYVYYIFYRVM